MVRCEGCASTNVEVRRDYLGHGRYVMQTRCEDCGAQTEDVDVD